MATLLRSYLLIILLSLTAMLGAFSCKDKNPKKPAEAEGWVNLADVMVGRKVQSIEIDPSAPSTIYVGLFDGLYKTTDGGKTWSTIENGLSNRDIKSIALCRDNPQIIYCGSWGRGISRTENGGSTWTNMGGAVEHTLVNAVHLVGQKDDAIWLATSTGIFRKRKAESDWSSTFKNSRLILSVTSIPGKPATLILGMMYTGFARTSDDGSRWTYMNAGVQGYNGLYDSPVQFAFGGADSSRIYVVSESGYFYLSTDEGVSWQYTFQNIGWEQGVAIRTDPQRPQRLYACSQTNIYRSDDNGLTWLKLTENLPAVVITSFQVGSGTENTLYVGTLENGLFRYIDSN